VARVGQVLGRGEAGEAYQWRGRDGEGEVERKRAAWLLSLRDLARALSAPFGPPFQPAMAGEQLPLQIHTSDFSLISYQRPR